MNINNSCNINVLGLKQLNFGQTKHIVNHTLGFQTIKKQLNYCQSLGNKSLNVTSNSNSPLALCQICNAVVITSYVASFDSPCRLSARKICRSALCLGHVLSCTNSKITQMSSGYSWTPALVPSHPQIPNTLPPPALCPTTLDSPITHKSSNP